MGQVLPMPVTYNHTDRKHTDTTSYNRDASANSPRSRNIQHEKAPAKVDDTTSIPALELKGLQLHWTRLDDVVMGGKSHTKLVDPANTGDDDDDDDDYKTLHFQGTIDTRASVGFASVRAPLPPTALVDATALRITCTGDGITYKVLLMDAHHGQKTDSPLWEADLFTSRAAGDGAQQQQTHVIPLKNFVPSHMGHPLAAAVEFQPSRMARIGIMLSSCLSDGSFNPTYLKKPPVFEFHLHVQQIETVY